MPQYDAGHTYASPEAIHAALQHQGTDTHREDAPANDDPLTRSLFWFWVPQEHVNRAAICVRWGLTNSTYIGAYPRIFLQGPQEILSDAAALLWDAITEAEGSEAPPVRDRSDMEARDRSYEALRDTLRTPDTPPLRRCPQVTRDASSQQEWSTTTTSETRPSKRRRQNENPQEGRERYPAK